MDLLDDLYARHPIVHLLFSGGKDSTLCLQKVLSKGFGPRTVVLHVNTGCQSPEVLEYIESYRPQVLALVEIHSNVMDWIKFNGFPSELVDVDRTNEGRSILWIRSGLKVCSRIECCRANLWNPLRDWIAEHDVSAMVFGEKDSDPRGARPNLWDVKGKPVEICRPISLLDNEGVRDELKEIMPNYPARFGGDSSSVDCACCTAFWEYAPERLAYLDKHMPEFANLARGAMRQMYVDAKETLDKLKTSLENS